MQLIKKFKIVSILLLFLWMIVIFFMSAQPAQESSQLSGGIVDSIIKFFCKNFSALSQAQQLNITNTLTLFIRKFAHFSEYFILGILSASVTLLYFKFSFKVDMLISIAFCVIYACSDEIHQFFVPGRACRFTDICIDSFGSAVAIILLTLFVLYKKHRLGELNA